MIQAKIDGQFDALALRLARKAAAMVNTRQASRRIAGNDAARRWRRADWLWPLFAKG